MKAIQNIFYLIICFAVLFTGCAENSRMPELITDGKPVINDFREEERTETFVSFSATVTDEGDAPVTSRGFIYAKTIEGLDGSESVTVTDNGEGAGFFKLQLSDSELEPNQIYYITAFAKNSYGEIRGDTLRSYLSSDSPIVLTDSLIIQEIRSLLFKGRIIDWGKGASTGELGFVYSTSVDSLTLEIGSKVSVENLLNGNFEKKVSGLLPETTYHVRTYATNSNNQTSYGKSRSIRISGAFELEQAVYDGPLLEGISPVYLMVNPNERQLGYLIVDSNPSNKFWEFNPVKQLWTELTSMPVYRSMSSSVHTSTTILFFGGKDENGRPVNDMYHYDYTLDSWQETRPSNNPPTERYASASGYAHGSIMYLIGGVTIENNLETITDEVHAFRALGSLWLKAPPSFPEAQCNGFAFVVGERIYSGLGYTSLDAPQTYGNKLYSLSENETEWTEHDAMPGSKALGGTVVDSNIYVVDDQGYIHIFDTVNKVWKEKTEYRRLPVANRKIHCVYGFTGSKKIYIGLGEDSKSMISYDTGWGN
jgi:N-acetylneuraminic acid mutarotase